MSIFTLSPIETEYLDTPGGLVTLSGEQYVVRESELQEWANSVFQIQPLRNVLGETRELLGFPESLLLLLAPILALTIGFPWAVVALLVAYPVATVLLAPVTAGAVVALARYANLVPVQAIYYIVFLSVISQTGNIPAVLISLVFFVLVRLGVLGRIYRWPVGRMASAMYRLRLPDVTLRSRILNIAAAHGIILDGADDRNLKIFSWRA